MFMNSKKEFKSVADLEFLSRTQNRIIVSFEGDVYDLTQFASKHPGGAAVIRDFKGQSVDNVIFNPSYFRHSRAILSKLEFYKIGTIAPPQQAAKPATAAAPPNKNTTITAQQQGSLSKQNASNPNKQSAIVPQKEIHQNRQLDNQKQAIQNNQSKSPAQTQKQPVTQAKPDSQSVSVPPSNTAQPAASKPINAGGVNANMITQQSQNNPPVGYQSNQKSQQDQVPASNTSASQQINTKNNNIQNNIPASNGVSATQATKVSTKQLSGSVTTGSVELPPANAIQQQKLNHIQQQSERPLKVQTKSTDAFQSSEQDETSIKLAIVNSPEVKKRSDSHIPGLGNAAAVAGTKEKFSPGKQNMQTSLQLLNEERNSSNVIQGEPSEQNNRSTKGMRKSITSDKSSIGRVKDFLMNAEQPNQQPSTIPNLNLQIFSQKMIGGADSPKKSLYYPGESPITMKNVNTQSGFVFFQEFDLEDAYNDESQKFAFIPFLETTIFHKRTTPSPIS